MLSEQELDTLYGEVNRPYSPKELTAHLADREVKSAPDRHARPQSGADRPGAGVD